MLRIEFEPPSEAVCPCCKGRTTRLTRFVYRNDDAYAVYYARFSDNHPDRTVLVTVSLGEWTDGSTPDQRVAFALKLRSTENEYRTSVINASESPWNDVDVLGRTLDRTDALAHPLIQEVFHITDHMVAEDMPLKAYLDSDAPPKET